MKKLMFVTASLLALGAVAPAVAADLPARTYTKAPPLVQAAYDWSGFYIGINGGGATGRTTWNLVGGPTEGSHDATGGTVGGQIGYRWQQGPVVFGVEAQGNWADFTGNNVSLAIPGDRNQTKIDAFGLFTGQIGYAWNNALLYVKGGAAVVDDKYSIVGAVTNAFVASTSDTRWGGTVGVGFEYGFAPNWSFGVEYDHLFLGSSTENFTTPAGVFVGSDSIKQNVDLFTARVNYKFGGPVVARY
ncbi:MAG: porin family protein [Bradyrhizobium sp.]|nr:porin family protein [Bradyrhizobium sp.]